MTEFLKCAADGAPNDCVVITDGDIRFYDEVNGEPKLSTAITQLGLYSVENGGTVVTNERFVTRYGMPQVFLAPSSLKTFAIEGVELDQGVYIESPSVTVDDAGRASFGAKGGLVGYPNDDGCGSVLVPRLDQRVLYEYNDYTKDWYDTIPGILNSYYWDYAGYYDYVERYYAEWTLPVFSAKSASVCASVVGNALRTRKNYQPPQGWEACAASWDYSLRIGIGGSLEASIWGDAVTGIKPNDDVPIFVSAYVAGGSGTHVHIQMECKASTENVSLSNLMFRQQQQGENRAIVPLFVNVDPDENIVASQSEASFTALVVGR